MKVLVATTCTPDDRKTLCAVRSLAREGFDVVVGGDRFAGRSFASRYARQRLRYPHPAGDERGFVGAITQAVERGGPHVILPTSDYTVAALSARRDAVEPPTKTALPPDAAAARFRDKLETLTLARSLGLEVPETFCPASRAELGDLVATVDRPFVVKPRRSTGAIGFRRVDVGDDLPESLPDAGGYVDTVFDFSRPLVQEYICGDVHDVCVLCDRGEVVAVLTQRRLKMFPATGGAGILNETTDEPELVDRAVTLLGAVGWHGPAQVEFKRSADGTPYLMEVNGRLWGTVDLAVAAGIDFPTLTCRLAMHGEVPSVNRYTVGLRFRWPIPFGLLHAAETGRWCRALWEFFGPQRGVRSDFRWSDPLPWVGEGLFMARRWRRHRGLQDDDPGLRRLRTVVNLDSRGF